MPFSAMKTHTIGGFVEKSPTNVVDLDRFVNRRALVARSRQTQNALHGVIRVLGLYRDIATVVNSSRTTRATNIKQPKLNKKVPFC